MKVWVTGASGLAGRAVTVELEKNHEVLGTGFSRTTDKIQAVDLTSEKAVKNFFEEHRPDAVVHLAAERKPDICENNHGLTTSINVEASRRLARLAKEYGSWLLYFSTDYVFDGSAAPYEVDDQANPLNFYGETKLAGEKAVQEENAQAAILRVPVLYGYVETLGESAITTICKSLLSDRPVKIDHWATRFPTFVNDLGRVIANMLEVTPAGIYHYSAAEAMTKYETVMIMGETLGLSVAHITGDTEKPGGAPRPMDCQLSVSALKNIDCYVEPSSLRSVIRDILHSHVS